MELLVRTFDRYTGSDVRLQSKNTRRGDVIRVQEDGSYWGPGQRKNPAYIILRVAVVGSEARAMLTGELGDTLLKPLLQLRAFNLNLDLLATMGHQIPDEAQARAARYPNGEDKQDYRSLPDAPIITVSALQFRAAKVTKLPLVDPLVIG